MLNTVKSQSPATEKVAGSKTKQLPTRRSTLLAIVGKPGRERRTGTPAVKRTTAKCSPPTCHFLVHRPRVKALIEEAVHGGVCWVTGPAGTGKTLAVIDCLATSKRPSIWYRADDGDNDIASFFHEHSKLLPLKKSLPRFGPEHAPNLRVFGRRYFRAFYEHVSEQTVLVFDDLQMAGEKFQELLAIAIAEMPPGVSCVCISRTLPFQTLLDLQLKGGLTTLDHTALNFTYEEARELFSVYGLEFRLAEHAHTLTQGWAAGMILLGKRYKKRNDLKSMTATALTDHAKPVLFHYLAAKVFTELASEQQRLLMCTSLLPEVSGHLADELLERTDGAEQLAAIYRRQLFILRRSAKEPMYVYHDLFKEFLLDSLHRSLSTREASSLKCKAVMVLEAAGYVVEAINLSIQLEDWASVSSLLVKHASALLAEGRFSSLNAWSQQIPELQLRNDPWLCYWFGVTNMIYDDEAANKWFERAYDCFDREGDLQGKCLAVSQAIMSRFYGWRSLDDIEQWVKPAISMLEMTLHLNDPQDELLANIGFLRALMLDKQTEQNTKRARQISAQLLRSISSPDVAYDVNLRVLASDVLMSYAAKHAGVELFDQIVTGISAYLDNTQLRGWILATWKTTFGTFSALFYPGAAPGDRFQKGEAALREAVAICEQEGFRSLKFGALCNLFYAVRTRNDHAELRSIHKQLQRLVTLNDRIQRAKLKQIQIGLHLLAEEYEEAEQASNELFAILGTAPTPDQLWPSIGLRFHTYLGAGQYAQAKAYFEPYLNHYQGRAHDIVQACIDIAETLALKRVGNPLYVEHLHSCLKKVSRHNWTNFLTHLPKVVAEVFSDALRHQIEPAFCQSAIRHRNLMPAVPMDPHWPWPAKLITLGRAAVVVDDSIVVCGPKIKSIAQLLKVLTVSGPGGCDAKNILSYLWPDASEGRARTSLRVTLHRARKMLNSEHAILLEEDRIRLNPNCVWIDMWVFEEHAHQIITRLNDGSIEPDDCSLAEQILLLYRGLPFGPGIDESWLLPVQERLKAKYAELVSALGNYYEEIRQWEKAIRVYETALLQQNLVEEFYRGIIRCKVALGEPAAAINVFRRCRETLSIVLGIGPAPATLRLVNSIRKASENTFLERIEQGY